MLNDGYFSSEIEKATYWWIEHVLCREQAHTFPNAYHIVYALDAAWVYLLREGCSYSQMCRNQRFQVVLRPG